MDPSIEHGRHTVAHLVSPYLFSTGSWIYTQLRRNDEFRGVVLTQALENVDQFPFKPVVDLSPESKGIARLGFQFEKYALGAYPDLPYRRVFAREGVDLIHAHFGWEGARTAHLSRGPRRPFVVSFYGRDVSALPRQLYWRMLYRRLFKLADLVIAEGSFMASQLERIGAPAEKIRVVHLGISLDEFPFEERHLPSTPGRDGPGRDATVVGLIAASFKEKKGIIYAIDAFARIAAEFPLVQLRLIGDGPLRSQIESRIAQQDLARRVTLLGELPYSMYRDEVKRAHFLMAPSITAADGDTEGGSPVCILEAQASGLPIVATQHADIPEATVPGASAVLAPERDVPALANCLEELLHHPERWAQMGRAGRAHIEAEFECKKQMMRVNELYRELLSWTPSRVRGQRLNRHREKRPRRLFP